MNENSLEKFMEKLDFDETQVNKGIEAAMSDERNASPRYNPYYLLQTIDGLDRAIELDQENQAKMRIIRSNGVADEIHE